MDREERTRYIQSLRDQALEVKGRGLLPRGGTRRMTNRASDIMMNNQALSPYGTPVPSMSKLVPKYARAQRAHSYLMDRQLGYLPNGKRRTGKYSKSSYVRGMEKRAAKRAKKN